MSIRAFAIASILTTIFALPSWAAFASWGGARVELVALKQMNLNMEWEIAELGREIRRLENPQYVERILRDEWGYQRPGDLGITFQ